jgi:Gas vesicle synthesis protein GvpO
MAGSNGKGNSSSRSRSNGRLSGRDAVLRVRRDLPPLLGRRIESVVGFEKTEGDGWCVTVQVVELSRIPHTTDVIGDYAVTLDDGGEVVGYRRTRRYHRNQADEG